jgi:putative ABC transport system permease protein
MRQLDRKLVRDLWQMKGQSLAISLVIASGVATFVMSLSTLSSLGLSKTTYYERYGFAHVFGHLKRAPKAVEARIAEIPGVAAAEARIVEDVTADVRGLPEPAVARLISLPEHGVSRLNRVHLRFGRTVSPNSSGEVIANEAFTVTHHLNVGDSVTVIVNGRRLKLKIVGIGLSPEYIIQVRGTDALPDQKQFGVFWMREEELGAAFDLDGAFNDVTVQLMPGAMENEVIRRLDRLIEPYGGVGAYPRADQLSNFFITQEIKQLRSMGLVAPSIFLSVAAFLLHVVMARQIGTQREQIAALKAFGYSNLEVGWHYLKFVLAVVVVGFGLGVVLGAWLGRGLTILYAEFYHFPVLFYYLEPSVVASSAAISIGAGVLGTIGSVRAAVRLPPAEAMRPEPPAAFRPTVVERLGLQGLLSQASRMVLRQLERRPLKSLLSSFGIALAVAVLVLGNFMEDSIDYLLEFQFFLAQRQDMNIAFVEPRSRDVVYEIAHLPGVLKTQPFRSLPVRLRHGHLSRRVSIMGFYPGGDLFRLMDRNEKIAPLPEEGLVISTQLAKLLHAEFGDSLRVEVQEGERPIRDLLIVGLVDDYSGTNAYMDAGALHRMMKEGDTLSGCFVLVDHKRQDELYRTLKSTPHVASVTVKQAMLKSFNETVKENQMRIKMFNVMFACVIAFGVVYNTARISLSERSRELATLRVIGFTRREISAILLGELFVLTIAAIPLGLLFGYGFAWFASRAFNTDLYRIPLVVNNFTFGFAAAVVLLASLLSGLVVRRRLDELDLVAVLKSKE